MCMTMADPTWAFVLSAPEVWRLRVNLLRRCSLKSPCVTVPLPQLFFLTMYAHLRRYKPIHVSQMHTWMIISHFEMC